MDTQTIALSKVTRQHRSHQSRLNPGTPHEVPTRALDDAFAHKRDLEKQRDECRRAPPDSSKQLPAQPRQSMPPLALRPTSNPARAQP